MLINPKTLKEIKYSITADMIIELKKYEYIHRGHNFGCHRQ